MVRCDGEGVVGSYVIISESCENVIVTASDVYSSSWGGELSV